MKMLKNVDVSILAAILFLLLFFSIGRQKTETKIIALLVLLIFGLIGLVYQFINKKNRD